MKVTNSLKLLAAVAVAGFFAASSKASLTVAYQFVGNGNWSIDGYGDGNGGNVVSALVPAGSVIEKAFLYSSTYFNSSVPVVNFDGTVISSWTAGGYASVASGGYLQAFRADVTSQVAAKVGAGGLFNFTIAETSGSIDGEVLAVIYSNPAEQLRTIAFLDGFSATSGDTSTLNLASSLTTSQLTDPNFQATMSLGIGFSYQGAAQYSTVDVNGSRLTSSAGGSDDGADANGSLLTVGGLGDDASTNPANPFAMPPSVGTRYDDELYNLTPFLKAGDQKITINTTNPSDDDNIFFAGFSITAVAGVNQPPPPVNPPTNSVPDSGATVGLLGLALAATVFGRRLIK